MRQGTLNNLLSLFYSALSCPFFLPPLTFFNHFIQNHEGSNPKCISAWQNSTIFLRKRGYTHTYHTNTGHIRLWDTGISKPLSNKQLKVLAIAPTWSDVIWMSTRVNSAQNKLGNSATILPEKYHSFNAKICSFLGKCDPKHLFVVVADTLWPQATEKTWNKFLHFDFFSFVTLELFGKSADLIWHIYLQM